MSIHSRTVATVSANDHFAFPSLWNREELEDSDPEKRRPTLITDVNYTVEVVYVRMSIIRDADED